MGDYFGRLKDRVKISLMKKIKKSINGRLFQ
jgi:hypothetical protein